MPEIIRIGPLELHFLRSKEETGGSLDMFEMICPPEGQMPAAHYHRDWEETAYGLEGTITFTVDGKPVEIGPSDHLFIPRGIVHGFDNRSGARARCLSILTPGVLGPGYFRALAALVAAGPPNPAALRGLMLRHGLVPVDNE